MCVLCCNKIVICNYTVLDKAGMNRYNKLWYVTSSLQDDYKSNKIFVFSYKNNNNITNCNF